MAGRIMTRMTTDVDALSTFLQTGLVTWSMSLADLPRLIAVLLIDIDLGLALFASCRCWSRATSCSGVIRRAYTEAREKVSVVNADLQENVAGLRVAQATGREGRTRRVRRAAATPTDAPGCGPSATSRSTSRSSRCCPTGRRRARARFGAAARCTAGTLTAGALIAFLLYMDMLFSPDPAAVPGLRLLPAGAGRPAPDPASCCDTPTTTPQPRDPPSGARPAARRRSCSDDVAVRLPSRPAGDGDLAGRSPGSTCGSPPARPWRWSAQTGAGKSTLVKLVARFYDVTGGRGPGRRHRRTRLRPGRLPAAARRGPAGAATCSAGTVRDNDRLRPPGRVRRRGRGSGARRSARSR